MFSKHPEHVLPDLSLDLRDQHDWKLGQLRTFNFPHDITSLALEPVTGLLAVGTSGGIVYIFGSPGVESKLTISKSVGVRSVHFAASTWNTVCLGTTPMLLIKVPELISLLQMIIMTFTSGTFRVLEDQNWLLQHISIRPSMTI